MKSFALIIAASLMGLVPAVLTDARAQDACHNSYGQCMDRCATRPASVQGTCSQICETGSNQCYEGMYGRAGGASVAPSAARPAAAAPVAAAPAAEAPAPDAVAAPAPGEERDEAAEARGDGSPDAAPAPAPEKSRKRRK